MRIWSIHPKYLDTKGLLALWRETLLAKHVLEGKTKGYLNHPQLLRFKQLENPTEGINEYLTYVHQEATSRGYKFDGTKLNFNGFSQKLSVTAGQIDYEKKHLLRKLEIRDTQKFQLFKEIIHIELHPMFFEIEGEIESWEIVYN